MLDFLAITWNVNPDIFAIGNFHLRWYSVLFVAGLFPVGYYIMRSFYKREGIPVDTLDALLFALFIGTLVGARLGHCLFYDPVYYLSHPWKILMTWEGGLASHGGAVGVLLAIWWYVHKYGKKYGFGYIQLIDRLVIPICFAGRMIRLGNRMNSEIYGVQTDLPWGFIFPRDPMGDGLPHHPTQLYEALSYCILGLVLLWMYRTRLDKLRTGTIFGIFLIVLFGMRFLIEFIKEDQVAFEQGMTLNMGQWLSVPFIIAGILLLVWSLTKAGPAAIHVPQTALSGNGKGSNGSARGGQRQGASGDKVSGKPKEKVPLTHVHSGSTANKDKQ